MFGMYVDRHTVCRSTYCMSIGPPFVDVLLCQTDKSMSLGPGHYLRDF